jgi:phosphate transport system permease protein
MVWLTGGSLAICLAMIIGLLALVFAQGVGTFWPEDVVLVKTARGPFMGEVAKEEEFAPGAEVLEAAGPEARARVQERGGVAERRQIRTANYELTNEHYTWVSDFEVQEESLPEWAIVIERLEWGRFYGFPERFVVGGETIATEPSAVWEQFERHHERTRDRWEHVRDLQLEIAEVNARIEESRQAQREVELEGGRGTPEFEAAGRRLKEAQGAGAAEIAAITERITAARTENARYRLVMKTADGQEKDLELAQIVRAYPANQLSVLDKIAVYASRWIEFVADEPREANSEGGVWPAIFGTVVMTLVMSILVVPFGVLAALYLREYAKAGPFVSAVRVAINNLAGVPSIVFGVFGLGFFCYAIGASIDELFFAERLPSPTYGTGGLLWASLTLALLTLPVVIVATEEALAAVPRSMREGSYACGASKWQTIRRIVLPRAMPGIMTGMILAIARGAGEVAPLMLVGAQKSAPHLPVDGDFPFVHPQRSFMHLGFHIYDLGFQSQNSEAAKPMVYTTTLLLILLIVVLNLIAIAVRARLRRRFRVGSA